VRADKTTEGSLTDDCLDRFADAFRCPRTRWADYVRIMKAYFCQDEDWLLPLVDLCDHLGCAAELLDETLRIEHGPDYDEKMGESRLMPK
jgi:hypothetical protein